MSEEPHSQDALADFVGFAVPQDNWFPVPNNWFDRWIALRQFTGKRRILAPLLVMLYLLKHALWKWQKGHPFHLTRNQISAGIRRHGQQLDLGTGLTLKSIRSALKTLASAGWIIECVDRSDQARERHLFSPRLIEDSQFDVDDLASVVDGFPELRSNYFQVPNIFTDIVSRAQTRSEVLIQSILYLIRHSWGWQDKQARWLTADEIANGRQYADGSRYDQGIGYDEQEIRDALNRAAEGIELADACEGTPALIVQLILFRDDQDEDLRTRRRYALRMRGTDALRSLARGQPDSPNSGDERHPSRTHGCGMSRGSGNSPPEKPITKQTQDSPGLDPTLDGYHGPPIGQSDHLTRPSIPPTGQSNPLTGQNTPLNGHGTSDLTGQSIPQTGKGNPLAGDCHPLKGASHPPGRGNPPRSDSNTLVNTPREQIEKTPSPTPADRGEDGRDPVWLAVLLEAGRAAGENPSADLLAMLGVRNPAREQLSHLEPALILAAAVDVWNQSGLYDPVGVLVGRLRDPDTAASYHATLLAALPADDFLAVHQSVVYPHWPLPVNPSLRSLAREWKRQLGDGRKPELPLPVQILIDQHPMDGLTVDTGAELLPGEEPAGLEAPPSPHEKLWVAALQQLEWRIHGPVFKHLFPGTEALTLCDGILVVQAFSESFAEILNYRFRDLVTEVVREVSDDMDISVRFVHQEPEDNAHCSQDVLVSRLTLGFQEPGILSTYRYSPTPVPSTNKVLA